MADFDELPCEKIVFRGAIYKKWIKNNGTIHWHAFRLREDDKDGVSLSMVPDKFEGLNNPVEGVISVHCGKVRDVTTEEYKLDVIQDKELHATLTGLPYPFGLSEGENKQLYDDMTNLCIEVAKHAARNFPQDA